MDDFGGDPSADCLGSKLSGMFSISDDLIVVGALQYQCVDFCIRDRLGQVEVVAHGRATRWEKKRVWIFFDLRRRYVCPSLEEVLGDGIAAAAAAAAAAAGGGEEGGGKTKDPQY